MIRVSTSKGNFSFDPDEEILILNMNGKGHYVEEIEPAKNLRVHNYFRIPSDQKCPHLFRVTRVSNDCHHSNR